MKLAKSNRFFALLLSLLLVSTSLLSVSAQAGMVTTQQAVSQEFVEYDRARLMEALNQEGVRDQLTGMGVDPAEIEQRIATLNADELAQLNTELANMPAGQGVVGVLLVIFVVFIITDMLCATDLFTFVKCINR
ncbi:PA2779 family protein [Aestuariicella sp. G3-2]|uniref:PA2779 family protein n=1 Tax=Pseudomaricurvus albidus TaxID=2842452 RepID=UPI001C0D15DC|nr:PA2779 family protein [Aestuariicella albida]MBU3071074.1 PA2779 family protein [Aestuariicella albida]